MRFKRRIRLETGLKQIEITPLIDCVFLLLVFFMLTSNFVIVPGINIRLPKVSSSESVGTKAVTLSISSEDIVYINGEAVTYVFLEDYLKKVKPPSIFIKSDRDASWGAVVAIWDICKGLGISKIGIATTRD
ncbi:MAG: biopolymer transporter ExbD [Candidatus Omnitrophota bacterium]